MVFAQVACSQRGNYFRGQYTCVQYPDLCNPAIIEQWWAVTEQWCWWHKGMHDLELDYVLDHKISDCPVVVNVSNGHRLEVVSLWRGALAQLMM